MRVSEVYGVPRHDLAGLTRLAPVFKHELLGSFRVAGAPNNQQRTDGSAKDNVAGEPITWNPRHSHMIMTNNCQLVRRARRKWYRRLTDTCNMHDRHSGLPVEFSDACMFAGDLNMRPGECLPCHSWADAFEVAGSPSEHASTWEPLGAASAAHVDQIWRFDRILWLRILAQQDVSDVEQQEAVPVQAGPATETARHSAALVQPVTKHVATGEAAGSERPSAVPLQAGRGLSPAHTAEQLPGSFASFFLMPGDSDHAAVVVALLCTPRDGLALDLAEECLMLCRPGLGREVARRPSEKESCAKQQRSHVYCGKDYEKARMAPGAGAIMEDGRRKGLYFEGHGPGGKR